MVNSRLENVKVDTLTKDSCDDSKVSIKGCKVISNNLSTDKISNDKLDVTSSRSKYLKEVDLVNAKIVKDKWEKRLTIEDSDYVVGVDNFSVIAKNESDEKVVGGKLDCFRGVDTNLNNDKLGNNLSISDGKLLGGKLIFLGMLVQLMIN